MITLLDLPATPGSIHVNRKFKALLTARGEPDPIVGEVGQALGALLLDKVEPPTAARTIEVATGIVEANGVDPLHSQAFMAGVTTGIELRQDNQNRGTV